MLAKEVVRLLAPFRHALTKNSFNTAHQCIEITKDSVRCRSSHVAMDVSINLDIAEYVEPVHVNGETLLAVLGSLPDDKELKLAFRDHALHWTCGTTKGKIACLDLAAMEKIPYISSAEVQPPESFTAALELGSLSCDATAMSSVGMSGVLIDVSFTPPIIVSTDDVTLSACFFAGVMPVSMPDQITLSAETIPFLMNTISDIGYWLIDDNTLLYSDGVSDMALSLASPLTRTETMLSLVLKCNKGKITAPIPMDTMRSFLKRADALTNNKPQLSVVIIAEGDRITLEFDEAIMQTQDYFTVPGLVIDRKVSVRINARKFARALKYADEMVLDFIGDRMLVLRSAKRGFLYIIGGRA